MKSKPRKKKETKTIVEEPVKCSACLQEIKGEECSHFTTPLNNCRNGLISWLETEMEK